MKMLRTLFMMLIYSSVASMVAQLALLGVLYFKGNLNSASWFQMVAIVYDVDLYSVRKRKEFESRPRAEADISYEEVVDARVELMLDLDLREISSQKGFRDITELHNLLQEERASYDRVRTSFESRLEQLAKGAVEPALLDVQRQMESVSPKLAKDQIVRILDNPTIEPDRALQFVVTLVKSMPLDKRKKILAEFRNTDQDRLHEILRQIRIGVPNVELIRGVRDQLERFQSRS